MYQQYSSVSAVLTKILTYLVWEFTHKFSVQDNVGNLLMTGLNFC